MLANSVILQADFVRNIEDIITAGQEVTVTIKEVDPEKNRISLSMRDREAEFAATVAGRSGAENSNRAPGRGRALGLESSGGGAEGGRAVNRG